MYLITLSRFNVENKLTLSVFVVCPTNVGNKFGPCNNHLPFWGLLLYQMSEKGCIFPIADLMESKLSYS